MLFGVSHGHRAFAFGHLDAGGEGICALDTVSEGSSPVAVSTHDGWAGGSPAQPAPILVLGDVPDRLLPQATDSFQVLQQPDRPRPDCHVSGHSTHQSTPEPQQAAFRPQRTIRSRKIYSATATPEAKIPGRPWTFRASGRSWYASLTATAGPAARMSR